ncbi:MAG TPA: ammonia-forming cytochrome c nitrite reductase subunit c552 [Candidatus Acidoferrales bacterium]|nr:ammonia-forming cytochrome c nitrite reductase subunit c552 [Candidatus Acidoferrales bacterium]
MSALALFLRGRLLPTWRTGGAEELSKLSANQELAEFLRIYWQRPIALQGAPPRAYSDLEASLRPEACGACHPQQFVDWQGSLHARAMGPGPWGQIIDLTKTSPDDAMSCMACHAPLGEQFPLLTKGENQGGFERNPRFDSALQLQGITCAACHVRQRRRFGPPKPEGAQATRYPPGMPNHGGAERTPHFERAEFCKDCHQFDPENSLLVNGKPLQDTYREWKNSIWGKGDAACQDCHMPNRRHLWRGIHDREWVKGGVQIKVQLHEPKSGAGETVSAAVEVTNSAVGHKFPTYVTPKIFVRALLTDKRGKELPGTLKQQIIGWDARFEDGEWKEFFDTRIPPGETLKHKFDWVPPPKAHRVRVWLEVHPDHFYHVHFYPSYLKNNDLSPEGRRLIERALEESGKTRYVLFEEILPLKTPSKTARAPK